MTSANTKVSPSEIIPKRMLFGNPSRSFPSISPDGKKMAYTSPVEGVMNVWIVDLGGDRAHPISKEIDRGVHAYLWDSKRVLYLQDNDGDETWHLFSADLTGVTVA